MNTKDELTFDKGLDNGGELDALFASARNSEPNLADDNFTKLVMNSLPSNNVFRKAVTKQDNKRGLSFDVIGALLGVIVAYFFIGQTPIINFVVNLVPESLVLSPLHLIGLIGASFALTLASVATWWTIESNQI